MTFMSLGARCCCTHLNSVDVGLGCGEPSLGQSDPFEIYVLLVWVQSTLWSRTNLSPTLRRSSSKDFTQYSMYYRVVEILSIPNSVCPSLLELFRCCFWKVFSLVSGSFLSPMLQQLLGQELKSLCEALSSLGSASHVLAAVVSLNSGSISPMQQDAGSVQVPSHGSIAWKLSPSLQAAD